MQSGPRRRSSALNRSDGTPILPTDSIRIVTNDFMYFGGGDGYTALADGTDVLQPGDDLMNVVIEYIAAHPGVTAAVEGRTVNVTPPPPGP